MYSVDFEPDKLLQATQVGANDLLLGRPDLDFAWEVKHLIRIHCLELTESKKISELCYLRSLRLTSEELFLLNTYAKDLKFPSFKELGLDAAPESGTVWGFDLVRVNRTPDHYLAFLSYRTRWQRSKKYSIRMNSRLMFGGSLPAVRILDAGTIGEDSARRPET